MGTTAIINNLTKVNPAENNKINVGYKVHTAEEENSQAANFDTYENKEFDEKVKSQMKDRMANLKVPNILDIKGKPASNPQPVSKSYWTFSGRDGSSFKLGYNYNIETGEEYNSNYIGILLEKAKGTKNPNYIDYLENMTAEIVSNFSTASTYKSDLAYVRSSINSIVDEIRHNIEKGKDNFTESLNTKITIGGVEWGFKDLLDTSVLIRNSFDGVDRTITMDYIEYAKMGLSIGNAQNFADKNLTKEQSDMVKSVLQARADYYDKRMDEHAEKNKYKWINVKSSEQRREYYKYGYYVSAANKELRNSIRDTFASVGKDTGLSAALYQYNKLMSPALKASGVSESSFAQVFKNHAKTLNEYFLTLSLYR